MRGLCPPQLRKHRCRQFLKVMREPRDQPPATVFLFQGDQCVAGMKLATEASSPEASIKGAPILDSVSPNESDSQLRPETWPHT